RATRYFAGSPRQAAAPETALRPERRWDTSAYRTPQPETSMTPIASLYENRIVAGALRDDPVQCVIFPEFERLRTALAKQVRKPAFFTRRSPEPVAGLYLWGTVGRGKSMLMDLFYDSVGIADKRRRSEERRVGQE